MPFGDGRTLSALRSPARCAERGAQPARGRAPLLQAASTLHAAPAHRRVPPARVQVAASATQTLARRTRPGAPVGAARAGPLAAPFGARRDAQVSAAGGHSHRLPAASCR